MSYRSLLLFVLTATLLSGLPVCADPAATDMKRIVLTPIAAARSFAKCALVIGVDDYRNPLRLHVCGNDAKDFAAMLHDKYGFQNVVLMTDDPNADPGLRPTQRNIEAALENLYGNVIRDQSEVVFFYSGHGTRAKDAAGVDADWLVPEDFSAADVTGTCVNFDQIRQKLDTLQPKRVLLLTDACRDLLGKGIGSDGYGKSIHQGLVGAEVAQMQSCKPTETSLEGLPGDFHESVFTHFLIKGMSGDPDARDERGNVTFDSLMQYVQFSVRQYAAKMNATQTPDGRATSGSMVLAMVNPRFAPPPAQPPVKPAPRITPPRRVAVRPAPPQPKPTKIRRAFVKARPTTPQQRLAANAALIALWSSSDGKYDDAKAMTLTANALQHALDGGAEVNAKGDEGLTSLMAMVMVNNAEAVRTLLDHGAEVNTKRNYGITALMEAARFNPTDAVAKLLIDHGADVNAKNNYGDTALTGAAEFNPTDAVAKLLIDHGADVNAKSNGGFTALMYAAEYNPTDAVAKLLIDHGADVNAKNNYGDTALTGAAEFNPTDAVAKLLIDHGADVNAKVNNGSTALMYAAEFGHLDTAQLLIDHGADVNAKNNYGSTALMVAEYCDKSVFDSQKAKMIALLEAAGSK